jgi:1-acyl-sn-glycerol-3-phosphate acyltransferase
MASKPWHYADCPLSGYFWKYAEKTPFFASMQAEANAYTDEERARDSLVGENLSKTAQKEIDREDNYLNRVNQKRSPDRIKVLKTMQQYEASGIFDRDVEEDPPSVELKPEDIDYAPQGIIPRVKTAIAFSAAKRFVRRKIKSKELIIKDIVGLENLKNLDSGAVITCNHFNAFDSFAIHMAYLASGQKKRKRKFYRVIREGNYTSFPGFYGFLMRNCNTLPLSSNTKTMCKFIKGVNQLLQEGHFVLFYPEQGMWWNYRKPRPLKNGAFQFSMMSKVPVLPCFITMKDSDILGPDGFYVQEYTIHIGTPIYPDDHLSSRQNVEAVKEENFRQWQDIYEKAYGIPLTYRTNEKGQSQTREA